MAVDGVFGKALADALRARTGQPWNLVTAEDEVPGWGLYIDGPQGLRLHAEDAIMSDRVYVSGIYPATRKVVDRFSCTAAVSRGAVAIAADIERKVLPGYRNELAAVLAYEAGRRADWDGRVAAVREAEKLFGRESEFEGYDPSPGRMRAQEASVSLPLRGAYPSGQHGISEHARVEATDGGALLSLDLKHVPAPVVLRMLKILADYTASLPEACPEQPREPKPFSAEFDRLYDQWLFSGDWQRTSWEEWISQHTA